MAIYNRPLSIEVTEGDYLGRYGSVERAKQRLFNIGAGSWSHPFWTNVDLPPQSAAFAAIQAPCLHHDLVAQSELPIESDSVDAFYCSHVVEHLPESAVRTFMREAHRCLARGGVLRIVTGPDADTDWQALMRGDRHWWFWMDEPDFKATVERDREPMTNHERWLHHLATPRSTYSPTPCDWKLGAAEVKELVEQHRADPTPLLEMLTGPLPFDIHFPGNHISWWNFEKLKRTLQSVGFTIVHRSGYGQSTTPLMRDLRYFDQSYPQISVSVEAIKT